MRVQQKPASRGSQMWLQHAIDTRPELLRHDVLGDIEWLSPLRSDDWAEYRDGAFLEKIGRPDLIQALAAFWPARGPQWDGLGLAGGRVVLVEAKAHRRELLSPPTQAGLASRARIEAAFEQVRAALGVTSGAAWTGPCYQYANRIAHLWFLRSQNVDAFLLLVDFLHDPDMRGPRSPAEWAIAYREADARLGLPADHLLLPRILHIHPDVRELGSMATPDRAQADA